MLAYLVAEVEITNRAGFKPYGGGGRRHGHAIWRPLPGPGRRDRTDRRRTGAETHRHHRIPRYPDFEALVRFNGIQKILPGRLDNSTSRLFVLQGINETVASKSK